jgi:PEP-CTERM motif-containing protein
MIYRLKAITGAAVVASALLTTAAAQAEVVYDNGPANGTVNAWTINFGYSIADNFTLAGPSTLTGANFTLWNSPGDVTSTVDWSILGSPTAGPALAHGTAAVIQNYQLTNGYGYDINSDNIVLPSITLGAGTYWFELENAIVSSGDSVYWDINGGPSQISESDLGYNPDPSIYAPGLNSTSNAFQILGTIPEPASLFVLGSGLVGLVLRRRIQGRSSTSFSGTLIVENRR